eukprot:CAMPEP_0181212106 /NCGR_PEP_ID=MMETSP1096-20121128/24167_1 /TAXON_ID=156174 ORGANISM="Chrysochromulina ericina, Strain CCMP281" /NCGR_SAMPLE_ID=MMETSP1096 /ASSEMBLY_ACC=CAM_ASM_000453 /LENGTH=85 /DNA_ID=CAMNT_0023303601 /DNA_START=493 /DNA_END=750 /DNA_ORIENTATION=-
MLDVHGGTVVAGLRTAQCGHAIPQRLINHKHREGARERRLLELLYRLRFFNFLHSGLTWRRDLNRCLHDTLGLDLAVICGWRAGR